MRLAYENSEGLGVLVDLSEKPVVVGRSPEADVVLDDEKVSRLHFGIRFDGQSYVLKDLGSRNGTYLNGERIASPTPLFPGDHVRAGGTLLTVQERLAKGPATILHEIEEEMDHGKGYHTLLREIVEPVPERKEE